jgi:hypothetical protein
MVNEYRQESATICKRSVCQSYTNLAQATPDTDYWQSLRPPLHHI